MAGWRHHHSASRAGGAMDCAVYRVSDTEVLGRTIAARRSDRMSVEATADFNELKREAGVAAAAELRDGMIVGLGSGSTARLAVAAIGRRVKQGLKIIGIPTSELTADQARGLAIPLSTLGEYPQVDVTIDGADEVELSTLNQIGRA